MQTPPWARPGPWGLFNASCRPQEYPLVSAGSSTPLEGPLALSNNFIQHHGFFLSIFNKWHSHINKFTPTFKRKTFLFLPTPASNPSAVLSILSPYRLNLKPAQSCFALYCPFQLHCFLPGLQHSPTLPASSLDSSTLFFAEWPGSFTNVSEVIPFLNLSVFRIRTQNSAYSARPSLDLVCFGEFSKSCGLGEKPLGKPSYGKCKVTVQSVGCWVGNKRPWQISWDSSGRQTNRRMEFLFLRVRGMMGQ